MDNPTFQKKWAAVKQSNKERLANYVENALGFKVNTHAMFDVQIKVCSPPRCASSSFLIVSISVCTSIRSVLRVLSTLKCSSVDVACSVKP